MRERRAATLGLFWMDLPHTVIVYGTEGQAAANAEAAKDLAESIRSSWVNAAIPIVSDREVTDEQVRGNHVLLVGSPGTNRLGQRFASAIPVQFGAGSFSASGLRYAAGDSAVIAAGENPMNRRYEFVVFAGNSAAGTYRAVGTKLWGLTDQAVVVLPAGGGQRPLMVAEGETVKSWE